MRPAIAPAFRGSNWRTFAAKLAWHSTLVRTFQSGATVVSAEPSSEPHRFCYLPARCRIWRIRDTPRFRERFKRCISDCWRMVFIEQLACWRLHARRMAASQQIDGRNIFGCQTAQTSNDSASCSHNKSRRHDYDCCRNSGLVLITL